MGCSHRGRRVSVAQRPSLGKILRTPKAVNMSAMYELPVVVPNSFTHMDTTVRMYTLPPIQGAVEIDGQSSSSSVQNRELLELEARQEAILTSLESLQFRVDKLRGQSKADLQSSLKITNNLEIAIHCSPCSPPFSLPLVIEYLKNQTNHKLFTSVHVHSSYVRDLPQILLDFLPPGNCLERSEADLKIALIWNDVGKDPISMVGMLPNATVRGEVNLLRFFARLFGLCGFDKEIDLKEQMKEDEILDSIHADLMWGDVVNDKKKVMNTAEQLVKSKSSSSLKTLTLSDFLAYSALKKLYLVKPTPAAQGFMRNCEQIVQG